MTKMKLAGLFLAVALLCSGCVTREVTEPKVKKEIPILAWYSIPGGEFATLERYQELRDAGFTISFSHCTSVEDMKTALDLAGQVGMKAIAMWNPSDQSKNAEDAVSRLKDHPALWGYYLRDEPNNEDFEGLGELYRKIHGLDPEHPCYMNLLSRNPFAGPDAYREHVDLFFKHIPLPQLSFDTYPICFDKEGELTCRKTFYESLTLAREKSTEYGVPFWAFALSVPHWNYPEPTIGHLRFQMYSNLCYGAQCLEYFTYWCPGNGVDKPKEWDTPFHNGPINHKGERTPTYDLVRDFNKELQNWADVFMGCKVQSVYHLGENLPDGTQPLPAMPAHFEALDTNGQSALVSSLENEGKQYVIVMNTSFAETLKMEIRTDDKVVMLRNDGTTTPANRYAYHTLTAGDIRVFQVTE